MDRRRRDGTAPIPRWRLIVLGDQPLPADRGRARLARRAARRRPSDRRPRLPRRPGRNPVLLGRAAFGLVDEATGDRGLGPAPRGASGARPRGPGPRGENPDVDTRGRSRRACSRRAGPTRVREPTASRSTAPRGPRRRRLLRPGDVPLPGRSRRGPTNPPWTSLRVARPARRDVARHRGGRRPLRAADRGAPSRRAAARSSPSTPSRGHARGLREIAAELRHRQRARRRGPLAAATDPGAFAADVSLIAHVSYDIEAIGAVRRRHGGRDPTPVRRGPDGAPAVIDRRCLLAAGPRRGAGRAAGAARVRRAAHARWAAPPRSSASSASRAASATARSWRGSCGDSSGSSRAGEGCDLPVRARRAGRDRCRRPGRSARPARRCRSASSPGRPQPTDDRGVRRAGRRPTVQPLTGRTGARGS